jgi:hypothetical protein
MADSAAHPSVSVRLEGGLGDHILGMRILRFVRDRYPHHDIVAFSDSRGLRAPVEIATMSPLVSRVVPISHGVAPNTHADRRGLETIRLPDLQLMLSGDLVIDTFGEKMLAAASLALDVPIFEVLAHRPELVAPPHANEEATRLLATHNGAFIVGVHLAKYGGALLRRNEAVIIHVLRQLLRHPSVVILNMFSSRREYVGCSESQRMTRQQGLLEEISFLEYLCTVSDRILPCVNLPLATIVALIRRCRYFIGLDNGIKHIAWALGVPRTVFFPGKPSLWHVLRWIPDVHRMLPFDCTNAALESHIAAAVATLRYEAPRPDVARSAEGPTDSEP